MKRQHLGQPICPPKGNRKALMTTFASPIDGISPCCTHRYMCYVTSNTVLGRNGTVPYVEFLAELDRAGLSVRSFAELIGMNPNSITNYAGRGNLPQHLALVAVLVGEMAAHGLDYRNAIAKVAPTRKPRGAARRGRFGGDRQANLDLLS